MIITKTFDFDAAHYLPALPAAHKCSRMHGHTYMVTVEIGGPLDPGLGWIVDYAVIAGVWAEINGIVDHRVLNEIPGLETPTSEVLALWLFRRFDVAALGTAQLEAVTLHESSTTSCRVTRDDIAGRA